MRRAGPLAAASGALLVLATACGGAGETPAATPRPDVVLLIADDLGWNDVGYHGSEIATPHIDSLAREGIELDRFYTQPQCTPTRAGLLTGRYPSRFGMQRTTIKPWDTHGIPASERLLPEWLAAAGYGERALVGKWHLGHGRREHHPLSQGFTRFYGHYNGYVGYYSHARGTTAAGEPARDWHRGFDALAAEGYATDLVADEAVRLVRAAAERDGPYLLVVPFLAPHYPNEAPADALAPYAHLPEPRRTHAAKVAALDAAVGRILAAIDETGRAESTLVVFLSDNGGDPQWGASNAPLQGGKHTPLEGGIRVPAAVRWGRGHAGRLDLRVTYLDVLPTLLGLLEVPTEGGPRLDGRDLSGVLFGARTRSARPAAPPHDDFFVYTGSEEEESAAVLSGAWKLVRVGPDLLGPRADHGRLFLFDVDADPTERNDLAPSRPDLAADLLERLRVFRREVATSEVRSSEEPLPGWSAPVDWTIPD